MKKYKLKKMSLKFTTLNHLKVIGCGKNYFHIFLIIGPSLNFNRIYYGCLNTFEAEKFICLSFSPKSKVVSSHIKDMKCIEKCREQKHKNAKENKVNL